MTGARGFLTPLRYRARRCFPFRFRFPKRVLLLFPVSACLTYCACVRISLYLYINNRGVLEITSAMIRRSAQIRIFRWRYRAALLLLLYCEPGLPAPRRRGGRLPAAAAAWAAAWRVMEGDHLLLVSRPAPSIYFNSKN